MGTQITSNNSLGYGAMTCSDSTSAQNIFYRSRGTTSAQTGVQQYDGLGSLSFRGHNTSSMTGSRAMIAAYANETWSTTANGTAVDIQTTANTTTTCRTVGTFTEAGQFRVPITGIGAGIVIGGDTQLYRSAADVITTPDSLTVGGKLTTVASASGAAGIVVPHGAAPSAPADGDIWTTTAGLFVRIDGVTKTVTLT